MWLLATSCLEMRINVKNKKVLLVAINAKYIHSNLAVYCLKKYAEKYSDYIEIAEYTINQYTDYIFKDIYKRRPDVVLFSCYIWNIDYVSCIIRNLRKVMESAEIWVGGPEVSYSAEDFLKEYTEVNGVMVGEGEKIFLKMMKRWIESVGELNNINGIVYRENNNIITNPHECIMDLSDLPFPYDNLNEFKNKIIYYESSRGCPYSCSYCLSSVDKKLRFRNLDLVKKELKIFINNNIQQVKFVDRTFNCNKSHAMEIWQFIKDNDNGVTNFHFEISADLIGENELELFKSMRPGLIQLEIGVQTTNSKTIREINRTMNLDKLKYVVEKINSFGNIHQHLDLIAGLPYEDYNSFIKSFNDVYAMHPEQLQLGFLKVLNGAEMQKSTEKYGLVYTSDPPYEVLSTKWLSFDDIIKLKNIEEMVELFHNSRQFTNTLSWLENKYESPFEMFEEIGRYYEAHKLHEVKHNRIQNYEIIYEYIKSNYEDYEIFEQLIILDIYLRENIKSRPLFLKEQDKESLREYYHKYKQAGKMIHIEEFSINVSEWFENKKIIKEKQIVLFDYNNKNPINLWCECKVITA